MEIFFAMPKIYEYWRKYFAENKSCICDSSIHYALEIAAWNSSIYLNQNSNIFPSISIIYKYKENFISHK